MQDNPHMLNATRPNKNQNGVTVKPGIALDGWEECRAYVRNEIHKDNAILKFEASRLPDGHNY